MNEGGDAHPRARRVVLEMSTASLGQAAAPAHSASPPASQCQPSTAKPRSRRASLQLSLGRWVRGAGGERRSSSSTDRAADPSSAAHSSKTEPQPQHVRRLPEGGFQSVWMLIEKHIVACPHATALSWISEDARTSQQWSYHQLGQQVNRVAGLFQDWGLGPGQRAVLMYLPGMSVVAALCACLRAGVAAVLMNPVRATAAARDLRRFEKTVSALSVKVVLTGDDFVVIKRQIESSGHCFPANLKWCVTSNKDQTGTEDQIKQSSRPRRGSLDSAMHLVGLKPKFNAGAGASPLTTPNHRKEASPDDLALIQLTENLAEAVYFTEAAAVRAAEHVFAFLPRVGPSSREVVVSWTSPLDAAGLFFSVLAPLAHGAHAARMPPASAVLRPWVWMEALSTLRATVAATNNGGLLAAAGRTPAATRAELDLRSLRMVAVIGEPARSDAMASFTSAFAQTGLKPGVVCPMYFLPEFGGVCARTHADPLPTLLTLDRQAFGSGVARKADAGENATTALQMVGMSQPPEHSGVRVAVVDPETNCELPEDLVGEVWIAGHSKDSLYMEDSDVSAAVFANTLNGAVSPAESHLTSLAWLRSNDLGFKHSGQLYLCGRREDAFEVAGATFLAQHVESFVESSGRDILQPGCAAVFVSRAGNNDPESSCRPCSFKNHKQPCEGVTLVAELQEVEPGKRRVDLLFQAELMTVRLVSSMSRVLKLAVNHVYILYPGRMPKSEGGTVQRWKCRKLLEAGLLDVALTWPGNQEPPDLELSMERCYQGGRVVSTKDSCRAMSPPRAENKEHIIRQSFSSSRPVNHHGPLQLVQQSEQEDGHLAEATCLWIEALRSRGVLPPTMKQLCVARLSVGLEKEVFEWRDVEIPTPNSDQLLVRVAAATLSHSDIEMLRCLHDTSSQETFPWVGEGSGTVVAAGSLVVSGQSLIGKRVAFMGTQTGTFAEFAACNAAATFLLPENVPVVDGCAFATNPFTAVAIMQIALKKGGAFISTAGASALGKMLVRTCARNKVLMIAIVRNEEEQQILYSLGAKDVFVFPWDRTNTLVEEQNRCRSEIQSAVVQAKCMIAFDFVGGAMTGILLSVLPNGGKVYASGNMPGDFVKCLDTKDFIKRGKSIVGLSLERFSEKIGLAGMIKAGNLIAKHLNEDFQTDFVDFGILDVEDLAYHACIERLDTSANIRIIMPSYLGSTMFIERSLDGENQSKPAGEEWWESLTNVASQYQFKETVEDRLYRR